MIEATTTNKMEVKVPVTRLKDYLTEVGINVSALAKLADINVTHLHKCLSGEVDERNGSVRSMSDDNLERLQEALHQLALRLKYMFILYNEDLEVVKHGGRRYCPDCVDQVKQQLPPYVSVLPFMQYALGWKRSKVLNVMNCRNGFAYGNISQDDVNTLNLRLAEVATRLDLLTIIR